MKIHYFGALFLTFLFTSTAALVDNKPHDKVDHDTTSGSLRGQRKLQSCPAWCNNAGCQFNPTCQGCSCYIGGEEGNPACPFWCNNAGCPNNPTCSQCSCHNGGEGGDSDCPFWCNQWNTPYAPECSPCRSNRSNNDRISGIAREENYGEEEYPISGNARGEYYGEEEEYQRTESSSNGAGFLYYTDFLGERCYDKTLCHQCKKDGNGNGCGCEGGSSCSPNNKSYVCNKKYKKKSCEKVDIGYYTDYYTIKCYHEELCDQCQGDNNGNGCGCSGFSSSCGPSSSSYVCDPNNKTCEPKKACSDSNKETCSDKVECHAGGYSKGEYECTKKCKKCCDKLACSSECKKSCSDKYYFGF